MPTPIAVNNAPKFYGIMLYLILASIGWLIGRMDTVQWAAVTGPVIGYLVGNGVQAARGEGVPPNAIGRRSDRDAARRPATDPT